MTSTADSSRALLFQRNLAGALAITFLAISVGSVLPGAVRRFHESQKATAKLIDLQSYIVAAQQRTRELEAEIIRDQNEIRALQKKGA